MNHQLLIHTIIVLCLVSSIAFGDGDASAVNHAPQLWQDALTKILEAEKLVDDGNTAEAIDMFLQANSIFDHLTTNYHNWNPEIVLYRQNYCLEVINSLDQSLQTISGSRSGNTENQHGSGHSTRSQNSSLPSVSDILDVLANDNELLKEENNALEHKLEILEQEIRILVGLNRKKDQRIQASLNDLTLTDGDGKSIPDSGLEISNEIMVIKLLYKASMAEQAGDFENARDAYKKILDIDDTLTEPLLRLGYLLQDVGDYKKSVPYFDKALKQSPNDTRIISAISKSYIKMDDLDEAATILEIAVVKHPLNAEFHHDLGVVYSLVGNLRQSEIHLLESFSLDNGNSNTAYKLAVLFAASDPPRSEDAKNWYYKAIHLGATNDKELEKLIFE